MLPKKYWSKKSFIKNTLLILNFKIGSYFILLVFEEILVFDNFLKFLNLIKIFSILLALLLSPLLISLFLIVTVTDIEFSNNLIDELLES